MKFVVHPSSPMEWCMSITMKLIKFGAVGQERLGVQLTNVTKSNVSTFGTDSIENFFVNNGI